MIPRGRRKPRATVLRTGRCWSAHFPRRTTSSRGFRPNAGFTRRGTKSAVDPAKIARLLCLYEFIARHSGLRVVGSAERTWRRHSDYDENLFVSGTVSGRKTLMGVYAGTPRENLVMMSGEEVAEKIGPFQVKLSICR